MRRGKPRADETSKGCSEPNDTSTCTARGEFSALVRRPVEDRCAQILGSSSVIHPYHPSSTTHKKKNCNPFSARLSHLRRRLRLRENPARWKRGQHVRHQGRPAPRLVVHEPPRGNRGPPTLLLDRFLSRGTGPPSFRSGQPSQPSGVGSREENGRQGGEDGAADRGTRTNKYPSSMGTTCWVMMAQWSLARLAFGHILLHTGTARCKNFPTADERFW